MSTALELLDQIMEALPRQIVTATQPFLRHFAGRVMVAAYGKNAAPVEGCFDNQEKLIAALNELNRQKFDGVYVTMSSRSTMRLRCGRCHQTS